MRTKHFKKRVESDAYEMDQMWHFRMEQKKTIFMIYLLIYHILYVGILFANKIIN